MDTNRDRPLRTGFGIIPNQLWTLPDLTPNQRCLLGWLHSHADNYTARLSISRIGREYGGGKRARDHLVALEDAGWLLIVHGEPGEKARVVLLSEPWEALLTLPQNVTPPSHETGEVPPTECDTPLPQNVTTENTSPEVHVEHQRETPSPADQLAIALADMIEQRGSKRPTVTKEWIAEMDRLMRIDGRTPEQIVNVLRWLHEGRDDVAQFWQPNIRSPKKLRAKWDVMSEQYARTRKQQTPGGWSIMDRIRQANARQGVQDRVG